MMQQVELINDIIPENLENNLTDSIVSYETIYAYNTALSLMPFKTLDNEEFKSYRNQAIETVKYWMKNIETPFNEIFLSIKKVFIEEETTVDDFTKAIYNLCDDPNNADSKEAAKEAIEYYLEVLNNVSCIDTTARYVDEFRIKLAEDSRNFKTIGTKLPAFITQHEGKIKEKQENLEQAQQEIADLTVNIRKKIFQMEVDLVLGKPGICCGISPFNFVTAIALAIFLFQRKERHKELNNLQDELSKHEKNYTAINDELYQLNTQLPLLVSMSTQVPKVYNLSLKAAEVAHAIKRAWDEINFNLKTMKTHVESFNTIEQFSAYKRKKLKENFDRDKKTIKKVITKYDKSNRLGLPFDRNAQQMFDIKSIKRITYVDAPPNNSGLFYMPYQSLIHLIK
jgi:hypothetical protein